MGSLAPCLRMGVSDAGEHHFFLDMERLEACSSCSSRQDDNMCKVSARIMASGPSSASIKIGIVSPPNGAVSECRICQEEEEDVGNLEAPCGCTGSLKFAHRKCVQRWCNEKGDAVCEICQQPYKGGYTSPLGQVSPGNISLDLSDGWGIPAAHPMVLRDPRIIALAAAEHRFLQSQYEEYEAANWGSAACCRSVALILMALLLLHHAMAMGASSTDEDSPMFFVIFLIRLVGFFLPCYVMARAMNMLQQRRQSQVFRLVQNWEV